MVQPTNIGTDPSEFDAAITPDISENNTGDKTVQVLKTERPDPVDVAAITNTDLKTAEVDSVSPVPVLEREARAAIRTEDLTLDDLQSGKWTADQLRQHIIGLSKKNEELAKNSKPTFADYLMAKDPEVTAFDTRIHRRIAIANDILTKAIAESNGSTVNDILKWGDRYLLRGLTIGMVEGLTRRSERESFSFRDLLYSAESDDDFTIKFKDFVESVKREGVLASDNIFALEEQLANIRAFGTNEGEATFEQFMSFIDAATIFSAPLSNAAKRLVALPTHPVTVTGVMRGPKAAAKLFDNMLPVGTRTDDGTISAVLSQGVTSLDSIAPRATINQHPIMKRLATNGFLNEIERLNNRGLFGRAIDPTKIEDIAKDQAEEFLKKLNLENLDVNLVRLDDLDNYRWEVYIGRNDGTLFKTQSAARARADKISRQFAEVEEAPSGGWRVVVRKNVKLAGKTAGYDVVKEQTSFLKNVFGSASNQEQSRLSALANLSESGQANIQVLFRNFNKTFNQLKKAERTALNDFFVQYRDGVKSYLHDPPDFSEFEAFVRAKTNDVPSKNLEEAYRKAIELNDTSWKLLADRRLKKALAANFEFAGSINNKDLLFRQITDVSKSLDPDELVLDGKTLNLVKVSDLKQGDVVFHTNGPIQGTQYVANPERLRPITHTDVLDYNFGGPRLNPNLRYFIGEEQVTTLASGKSVITEQTTILGARTEKEITKAFEEISTIRKADEAFKKGNLTRAEIDEIVAKNNSFNPSVETIDEFWAWADDVNYKGGPIAWKARDRTFDTAELDYRPSLGPIAPKDPIEEIRSFSTSRKSSPVFEYGVGDTVNPDPLEAMSYQFSNEAFLLSHRQYMTSAMEGWVKAARQATKKSKTVSSDIVFDNASTPNDFGHAFMHARIDNPKTTLGKRLKFARDRILRRMNAPTTASAWWDSQIDKIAQGLKNSNFPGTTTLQRVVDNTLAHDPGNWLLSAGYYSKFAFFNIHQLLLQSSQIGAIAAISPKFGTLSAVMSPFVRIALAAPPNVEKLIVKRMSKFFNFQEQEIRDMLQFIRDTGRMEVSSELLELGGNQRVITHSAVGKLLDKSAFFFKEGERNSRITSILTAIQEYKKLFPKGEMFSDHMRAWVARRDQELTFNMTGAGKSALQSNTVIKVATQWTSYMLRSMEAVFFGKSFTPGERLRLFTYLMPMWGLTGLGLGYAAPWVADQVGIDLRTEEGRTAYTLLKYGIFDGAMNWAGVDNTAAAVRFAPLGDIGQLIYDWTTNSALEVLGGPSGKIVYDGSLSLWRMLGNAMHGRFDQASVDLEETIRNISSVDNLFKAALILRSRAYQTRKGKTPPTEFGAEEFVTNVILGFPLKQVQEYYAAKSASWFASEAVKRIGKEVQSYVNRATRMIAEGDTESGYRLLQDVAQMTSLLTPEERRIVMERYWKPIMPDVYQTVIRLQSTGHEAEAMALITGTKKYISDEGAK